MYTAGNSWTETTVNWNTRPPRTSGTTDDKGAIATNTWVEFDVTPFVTGNGTYSFGLTRRQATEWTSALASGRPSPTDRNWW